MKSAIVCFLEFGKWHLPPELAKVSDSRNFSVNCRVRYGVTESDAVGDADLTVMSPQYLLDHLPDNALLLGREFLFQTEFDPHSVLALLSRYAASCTGLTDYDVLQRVSKVGYYEFDDYNRAPAIRQLVEAENDTLFPHSEKS